MTFARMIEFKTAMLIMSVFMVMYELIFKDIVMT